MLPDWDQVTLTILYTNDLHSHFDKMARIAAMVEDIRAENSTVLLLDIGDHMDRAATETEGTLGQANIDILNLTGYDAVTIGNNEGLTFTLEHLNQAYAGINCPVVCGNFRESATGEPPSWLRKHLVLQKGPYKVGLIGATAAYEEFYRLMGIDVLDPLTTIAESVSDLRNEVDLIVVMSHLGLPFDKELAGSVPGIDLIIGGHTHHLLEEPLVIGNTAITAAGKFGNYLGKIVISRDPVYGAPVIAEAKCLSVQEGEENLQIRNAITVHLEGAEHRLRRTVSVTECELPVDYSVESPFGNLLAQSVRRFTKSDLSIVNSGQLLAGLPQGEISEGMLHERCPSPINACRMLLKGADILYSLEESLLAEMTTKPISGFGFRGKVLGGLCVDGMEILYDLSAPSFERIVQASISGEPISPHKDYVVGTLDMFTFGIGYERLKNGTDRQYLLPEFLRDLIRLELQTAGAVESCFLSRWIKVSN